MKIIISTVLALFLLSACLLSGTSQKDNQKNQEIDLKSKANQLAQKLLLVDTHIDTPDHIFGTEKDISKSSPGGQFDYMKAKNGGLNAAFMSIYVGAELEGEESFIHANNLIDLVEKTVKNHSDKFKLAITVNDIREHFNAKVVSLPMGMENGSPLNGKLGNLTHFFNRGIRYITLCHFKSNDICDSSTDSIRPFNGLSKFGTDVVKEMNKLGIMVDISHVSDSTIEDVLKISSVPIIASHTSCRHFTPGLERNLSDDLIKKIAESRGVVMVNFGNFFLNHRANKRMEKMKKQWEARGLKFGSPEFEAFISEFIKKTPIEADIVDAVNHIEHIIKIAGIDHVGFGSDFDGVGPFVPKGLDDVSKYPALIEELLKRGYSESDLKKICGENLLRVWAEVEKGGI